MKVKTTISIDEELLKEIKDVSAKKNRNLSQQISKIIGDYLNFINKSKSLEQPRQRG